MGLRKLIRNIVYLVNKEIPKDIIYSTENICDKKLFLYSKILDIDILNVVNSINYIKQNNISLARFGDGELMLIKGQDIPFQKSSLLLSQRLKDVLSSNSDKLKLAIPRSIFHDHTLLTEEVYKFLTDNSGWMRDVLLSYIKSNLFLSTELSQAILSYRQIDIENYFIQLREIWDKKNITIVCGESVFSNIKYNIFDNAKSVDYIYTLSKNAFDKYDSILEKVCNIDKNRLIIIILGPTATILAYDLSQLGYTALDLGHICKSYDWWKKKLDIKSQQAISNFYSPD